MGRMLNSIDWSRKSRWFVKVRVYELSGRALASWHLMPALLMVYPERGRYQWDSCQRDSSGRHLGRPRIQVGSFRHLRHDVA